MYKKGSHVKYITRMVWILSVISLCTDAASEMLYPIMPMYLKSIGFSVLLIGILEGIAEAVAGFSKGYFGKQSDVMGKRVPFVQIGYGLSALSKPMMAVFVFPLWVFAARTLDRIGKGIRTGARDALLSDEATPQTKGKVFGFHRSMDTLGAVLGPASALLFLLYFPGQYHTLFYLAFIPGALAIVASLLLKEHNQHPVTVAPRAPFFAFLGYWGTSPVLYRKVVTGLLAFALLNSSDVFLLMKARQSGLDDTTVIALYIFYNLVYVVCAFPLGILADKIGLKNMFTIGLGIFAIVYVGFSSATTLPMYSMLFVLYAIYAAATEGISKAWISNISAKEDTATAIGTYAGLQSICALLASSFAGFLWYSVNDSTPFIVAGIGTVCVIIYLIMFVPPQQQTA